MNFFDLNGEFYSDFFNNNSGQRNSQARFFSKFTSDAKQAILDAFEISKNYKSQQTTVDHLFIALLNYPESTLYKILSENNLDINSLSKKALDSLENKNQEIQANNINLGPEISRHLNSIFKYAMAKVDINYLSKIVLSSQSEFIRNLLKDLTPETQSQEKTIDQNSIESFGTDLSKLAEENKLSPVIGRDLEIDRVIEILSRKAKNNPLLLGEPGVGKTSIAEGLALRIKDGNVPEKLKGKRIFALDLNSLISGTKYRGAFEENIKKLLDRFKAEKGNLILFIDEIHTIVGAGGQEGQLDVANILKPALARGDFATIGATTQKEFKKYFANDAALERRFQPVTVNEPTQEEAIMILQGLKENYENYHGVEISNEAIIQTVKLSAKYIQNRFLPDKAIDIIDEACARKSFNIEGQDLKSELDKALEEENFEKAAQIKTQLARTTDFQITVNDIKEIIEKIAKIPILDVEGDEAQKFLELENLIAKEVIGQEAAIQKVSDCIRRSKAGLNDPNQPIGTFLFLGPTGVGKTELVKSLARTMFGSKDSIIRLDMSEYMESHSVSKIIGAPAGYVGFEEGGNLIERVSVKPYSIILLDELEKAHQSVLNIFLQMMDEGHLTDSKGRTVSFKNTIIIATSNVGAEYMLEEQSENQENRFKVDSALKVAFRPEFLNRFDEIIEFSPLSKVNIIKITELVIEKLNHRLEDKNIHLEFSKLAIKHLAELGYNPVMGARPLNRVFKREVESELAVMLLKDKLSGTIYIDYKKNKLNFQVK